jgi:hypothetical protein
MYVCMYDVYITLTVLLSKPTHTHIHIHSYTHTHIHTYTGATWAVGGVMGRGQRGQRARPVSNTP